MALGKKINELTPLSDLEAAEGTRLLAVADPASGIASSATVAQLRSSLGTTPLKYVADGSEGTTLTIVALTGKIIHFISRENDILYDTVSAPDSTEYVWDGTDIELGLATINGQRFKIIYGN